MASEPSANQIPKGAAETQPSGGGLPVHLARLVNPKVLEMRVQLIRQRVADVSVEADLRRRYIETMADHLLKELKSA